MATAGDAKVRFVINPRLEAELVSDPELLPYMTAAAEQVATLAVSLAPLGDGPDHLRDSIESDAGFEAGRIIGRVNANKWTAWFVERGTLKRPGGQPFLAPAALDVIGNLE